ncbi:MAG: DUF1554 domain-containing protein [Leptospiraceae bacterium]|nr:DUF1554 domain-containing protein [Leptospiraceae bacterium]
MQLNRLITKYNVLTLLTSSLFLFCASEEEGRSTTYTIGGSITGLSAAGLLLQNNSGDNLTVANGATSFTFATTISDGASYSVTVQTQPTGLSCAVTNGSGTVASANITNISISCSTIDKKIFVTDATYNGNLGGFSGADDKCNSDGNKPSGGGTYKAMLVDGTNRRACSTANCSGGTEEHIDWVLKPNKKYVRSDGTTEIFTTNENGIFVFGTPTNAISETTEYAWTALFGNWTSYTTHCASWSATTGNTILGNADRVNSNAIQFGTPQACSNSAHLYCVEQ